MLISNTNGSAAQATQPPRLTGGSAPVAVVATASNVEATPTPAEQQTTPAQLKNVVDNINMALKQTNKNLEFSVDESTKKPVFQLKDTETGDLIRQFPTEEMLAISRSIDQYQQGLLLKLEA